MGSIRQLSMQLITITAFVTTALASGAGTDWDQAAKDWWAHVQFLADDKLEGRNTGSSGFKIAADYVEKQFEQSGLQPAGTAGFLQEVPFTVLQNDPGHSSWELERNGQSLPVELGSDAIVSASAASDQEIRAQAVFVGYGFAAPERGFDEFRNLDLRGKIAVVIGGRPASIPGPISTYYESPGERWKALHQAGAIALVTIASPKLSLPWDRLVASRSRNTVLLADPALNQTPGQQFTGFINPARADRFLEGTGHTISELQALADGGQPLPKFPLAYQFHLRVAVHRLPDITSPNLVGVLPGSDPQLKHEYVVLSAHLDHLGIGQPINGDAIYNGAMDNAAGIASLIEIARAISGSAERPKRSVLFLAFTGEESGMLGSQYFVAHPTVPFKDIVAALNMDMYLPLFPLRYLEVQGLGESTLGNDIRAVAQRNDIEVQFDKQPPENRFIRSDQASFVKQGVPGLAFKFGWLPGSAEEKIFNQWIHDRYHSPSDDTSQPVNAVAAAQFTHIVEQLVVRVANAWQRPAWFEESFYVRLAAGSGAAASGADRTGK